MSSATSIERRDVPPKAEESQRGSESRSKAADQSFRPWHFFVLASLAASTVAVILSRQSAPEHLILISFTIAAAGAAAAAVHRTILPFTVRDVSVLGERPSERARAALEREKALVLRSIKELEFDRAMGKVSAKDFDEMAGRLRARAISLMKQLDTGGSGYRAVIERELNARLQKEQTPAIDMAHEASAPTCAACKTVNDRDAAFCKRCGTALGAASR